MKFSTVEIIPVKKRNEVKWAVRFSDLDGDRENDKSEPNNLGFFHYPRRIGKAKAFELLKAHLVARHIKQIEATTKSLSALIALKPRGLKGKHVAVDKPPFDTENLEN